MSPNLALVLVAQGQSHGQVALFSFFPHLLLQLHVLLATHCDAPSGPQHPSSRPHVAHVLTHPPVCGSHTSTVQGSLSLHSASLLQPQSIAQFSTSSPPSQDPSPQH